MTLEKATSLFEAYASSPEPSTSAGVYAFYYFCKGTDHIVQTCPKKKKKFKKERDQRSLSKKHLTTRQQFPCAICESTIPTTATSVHARWMLRSVWQNQRYAALEGRWRVIGRWKVIVTSGTGFFRGSPNILDFSLVPEYPSSGPTVILNSGAAVSVV